MIRIPRPIARAPIALYRAGFGGLLGRRFVLLEHRGRISGQIRQVVLETLSVEADVIHVVSGYGWSAQWLRNVQADARVRVTCGWSRPRGGRALILQPDEAVTVLEDYRRRHRLATRALARALGYPQLGAEEPLETQLGEQLPVVRLSLRG
ncbi:MAG TPA: nitroreductase family deazaflavin-dependent oxidoreductase [Candidatus Ruania gallistercoris]|uniref:Nitroreductase family deazaflavin-dependent oxidoreductase n=1 Tax=Candidatus Ruania gallistercoris TaxID=2838746 RepID=A0A9D2J5L9_9MICO|nr:nitroreductase family deazaflavin-dependent oxidoreductase [Candidatus Ruania gallistercoris]